MRKVNQSDSTGRNVSYNIESVVLKINGAWHHKIGWRRNNRGVSAPILACTLLDSLWLNIWSADTVGPPSSVVKRLDCHILNVFVSCVSERENQLACRLHFKAKLRQFRSVSKPVRFSNEWVGYWKVCLLKYVERSNASVQSEATAFQLLISQAATVWSRVERTLGCTSTHPTFWVATHSAFYVG